MAEEFQNFCLLNTGTIHDQLHYGDGPLQFGVRHYIAIMVRPIQLLLLCVYACIYVCLLICIKTINKCHFFYGKQFILCS